MTANAELAVAGGLSANAMVLKLRGVVCAPNVMVWLAGAMLNPFVTVVAALTSAVAGTLAEIEQTPVVNVVTSLPETVQTPDVLDVSTTLNPEVDVGTGASVNGVVEKLRAPGLAKVIV